MEIDHRAFANVLCSACAFPNYQLISPACATSRDPQHALHHVRDASCDPLPVHSPPYTLRIEQGSPTWCTCTAMTASVASSGSQSRTRTPRCRCTSFLLDLKQDTCAAGAASI
eukprot:6204800-Pleurochrysis_carterae.AAC.1